MHALSLALLLAAAAPEPAAPGPAVAPVPVGAPAPRAVSPPVAPALVTADAAELAEPAAAAATPAEPAAPPAPPAPAAAAPSTPASPPPVVAPAAPPAAPAPPPPPLPQAAVEKLGQGDRAFLARDYRSALFAYQDAVYLAPRSPIARVKLGRAYLALRYPAQAIAQAEQALLADPSHAEARRLVEEARNPPRPAPAAPPQIASGGTRPAAAPAETPAVAPQGRVFRLTPEATVEAPAAVDAQAAPQAQPAVAEAPPAPAAPPAGAAREPAAAQATRTVAVVADDDLGPPPSAPPAPARSAGQRYRDALELLRIREFGQAEAALTEAIALDPRLAVARAARASARFGLGRYREAADDYRSSLALDPDLATPLFGLAECNRVLGDSRSAAEMYERYARSRAADVREDLRTIAVRRANELRNGAGPG
jgi:tetratricopeptide (TPR) repeat protein